MRILKDYGACSNGDTYKVCIWLFNTSALDEKIDECETSLQIRALFADRFSEVATGIDPDIVDWNEVFDLVPRYRSIRKERL